MSVRRSAAITSMGLCILACDARVSLSNSQVEGIINKAHSHVCSRAPLGKSAVGDQSTNPQLLSDSDFRNIQAWSRAGLVVLEVADTAPKSMSVTGVTKQINVVPSAAGLEAIKNSICGTPDSRFLTVEIFGRKVEKVISNEEVKTAVDTFRVVKGTATYALTDGGVRLFKEFHLPTEPGKNKFITLLKLDSFTGDWKIVATDFAGIDSDFKTNHVQRYLAGAGH